LTLQDWERQRGLVAASAGNHGQGVALAARQVGAQSIIFASEHAVPAKIAAMQRLGAEVRLTPGGYAEAESAGLAFARQSGATWVSPYNDAQVIAGQGTLALEILSDLPEPVPAWVVPVGGGGLVAGIGVALAGITPPVRLVGAQSEASSFFHAILTRGTQAGVVELPSLADGLAGAVEEGSLTIPLVQHTVDEIVLVSEEEIASAMRYAWQAYRERIEGSAAAALAAVLAGAVPERPALVVISGGNVQDEVFNRIVTG
jgi:threonine dehydratase